MAEQIKKQEFDPDEYLSFDPDEYLSEEVGVEDRLMQPIKSAVASGANVLTGGYLPQIAGAVESALTETPYVEARDKMIERLAEAEKKDALGSGIGSIMGAAGQMAIPVGRIAKAVESLPTIAKGAAAAGLNLAQAGLQNPGDVQGEINPIQFQERGQAFKDPVAMALSAVPLVSSAIGTAAKKAAKIAPEAKAAFKTLMPTGKEFKQALVESPKSPRSLESIGRFMLDEKILGPTSKVDDVFFRSEELLKKYGEESKSIYNKAKDKIDAYMSNAPKSGPEYLERGFDVTNKKEKIISQVDKVLKGSPEKEVALNKVRSYLDQVESEFGKDQVPDIEYLHKAKQEIGSQINFLKENKELPDTQRAYKVLLSTIQNAIDNELNYFDKIVGGKEGKRLRELDSKLSKLYEINNLASKAFGKTETRGLGLAASLGAVGGLGYGLSSGDPVKMLGGMALGATAVPALQAGANKIAEIAPAAKANILDKIINKPESRIFSIPLRGYLSSQMANDERIEGFPLRSTIQITPFDVSRFEDQINTSSLSNIEKAKRLNLIRKHGRVYLGN
jgi:hypothetical protein